MARPNQEAIGTFMSITGALEAVALQKLEEHGGDLNEAVNAYFNEGDRNIGRETSIAAQDDVMDIDDPAPVESHRPVPLLSSGTHMNPFSLLDPNLSRNLLVSGPDFTRNAPFVSHPRELVESPIEVKDGRDQSGPSSTAIDPIIDDVTGPGPAHGPENIIADGDDEDIPTTHPVGQTEWKDDALGSNSHGMHPRPSAPGIDELPEYSNDIEEEMVRAAIEASKQDAEKDYSNQQFGERNDLSNSLLQQRQSHLEDAELVKAVSLSLEMAEEEKALRELNQDGSSKLGSYKSDEVVEMGKLASTNGRLEVGSSSIQDEAEEVEDQPLVRNRSKQIHSVSVGSAREIGEEIEVNPSSSSRQQNSVDHQPHNGSEFHSDEWGGISSEEHDEAVMLEAALFGGIPEGSGYQSAYATPQLMQNGLDRTAGQYPQWIPRPLSPSLAAQRLIREQQDDEYLASLQADREKELKALEEAEARRLEERAAREAALEEEKQKEEESRRKLEEEQEVERQLAAKEASLPKEPASDDANAITLLVRMPDGTRRGRRFLKSDSLQALFDFIDVGRGVKPGTYRLVRPYPRCAFSDGESALTLNELGLASKQEALFLELI